MTQRTETPKVSTVYCPKEDKRVPIWHCLGSYTQGRETCPSLKKAVVYGAKGYAEVDCGFVYSQ
ncbi:hypothetical protein ES703_47118 [subsurface metagenome]